MSPSGIIKPKSRRSRSEISPGRRKQIHNWADGYLHHFLGQLIRLLDLGEKYTKIYLECLASIGGLASLNLIPQYWSTLGFIINIKENSLFDIIRKEGPIVLCDPDVQNKLSEWLSDKENVHAKMTSLRDALLTYADASPKVLKITKSSAAKRGRPKLECSRRWTKKEIKLLHRMITALLKGLKFNLIKLKRIPPKYLDLVLISFLEKMRSDTIILDKRIGGAFKVVKRGKSIKVTPEMREDLLSFKIDHFKISTLSNIREDKALHEKFLALDWMPHEFAKKILMKNFDISESKINKILYSKQG